LVASGSMENSPLTPAECVRVEADALLRLADRMAGPMKAPVDHAIQRIVACSNTGGRVIAVGLGKSGHIAQKFVATLNSLGTPAQFLHAAEAAHGDIGMVGRHDLLIAFSYSGETEELLRLLDTLKHRAAALIAVCGSAGSTLARASDLVLDVSVDEEACGMNLAPTASTTSMLALSDALAIEAGQRRNFRAEDFALLHPGGRLGHRLQRVRELMHANERLPQVPPETPLLKVIHEMSAKRLGMTTVLSPEGHLLGVISDGDLRRLLEREGGLALERTAGEILHADATWIDEDEFAATALAIMEAKKITAIVACNASRTVTGVLHLHDLWER